MLIFLHAILIGVFGYVFSNILIQPNQILSFYGKMLSRIKSDYIRKPLGDCDACFSGQVALWYSLLYYEIAFFEIPFFITLSILTANFLYNRL